MRIGECMSNGSFDQWGLWTGGNFVAEDKVKPVQIVCECGVKMVQANASDDQHSDYCPIFIDWKKRQDAIKKMP